MYLWITMGSCGNITITTIHLTRTLPNCTGDQLLSNNVILRVTLETYIRNILVSKCFCHLPQTEEYFFSYRILAVVHQLPLHNVQYHHINKSLVNTRICVVGSVHIWSIPGDKLQQLKGKNRVVSKGNKAWQPNSAKTFYGQPHKQASVQGHNNNSNNKA